MPELVTSTFQRTNEVYVYEYQYKLTFSNIYLCAYIYLRASSHSNCCSKCPIFSWYVWIHRCRIFDTISNGLLKYLNLPRVNPEKAMAPHSSTLAWKILWTEEPGRLQSMGLLKSQTRLSDFPFTFHFHALEKEMATHSSVLAWRIPGMGEPGGLYGVAQSRTRLKWLSSSSRVNPWTMAGVRTPVLCINWVPIHHQSRMFSFKCKPNSFGYDI